MACILNTLPLKTVLTDSFSLVSIRTPSLFTFTDFTTGCGCVPNFIATTPDFTGQGNFPLFEVKLAASSLASGVSSNLLVELEPFFLFSAAIASRINRSISLSILETSSCFCFSSFSKLPAFLRIEATNSCCCFLSCCNLLWVIRFCDKSSSLAFRCSTKSVFNCCNNCVCLCISKPCSFLYSVYCFMYCKRL